MSEKESLYPSSEELGILREVAAGRRTPDLIIRGGLVLSPGTKEWLQCDVVIAGRHIAALTPWAHFPTAGEELSAHGQHVVPTYIDAHLHIEYTNLTPGELARLSLARGTGTVLTDPNGAANVWGTAGMDFLLHTETPLRIFQQVSPTTPASHVLERGGAVISEEEVHGRLHQDSALTLGEGNPFDYGAVSTARFRAALAAGRRITGHTAAQTHESLWGYLAAGVSDDHNSSTLAEVLERTRLGAMITVMASSLADNTAAIFADLEGLEPALESLCFCADDKHVLDLSREGHIDHHLRQAMDAGVDPLMAYRMATMHPAHYYRLDQVLGVVAPSRVADLQIIPDLREALPSVVLAGGVVVARDGSALFKNLDALPAWTADTIHLPESLDPEMFVLSARTQSGTARVRAMEMYNGYFKQAFTAELPVQHGDVQADPAQDVLKIAVVDRHHGTADTGIGFVRGFGLTHGAIAISMNCPNMNIAVVGVDDESMLLAVETLRTMGGGCVAVAHGEVIATVPLPVGGMMSAVSFEETATSLERAHHAVAGLGCPMASPFIILSFVGLYVVPDYGITEWGLIDTPAQEFIDVLLPGPSESCGHD